MSEEKYNGENIRQFIELIVQAYTEIQRYRNEPEAVNYFARASCAEAVHIRNVTGVDVLTLSVPKTLPPLRPSHPIVKALSPLEHKLESAYKIVRSADPESRDFLEALATMNANLVWKGYLFLLNTDLENWGSDGYSAMGALRILSTADRDQVIDGLRVLPKIDPMVRQNVSEDDWPPRGFLQLWFKHRSVIAPKLGWPE